MSGTRKPTDLIMVVTSDMAGQLRGKAMTCADRTKRAHIGVGWTPTNIFQTTFGPIADTPWGAFGDLMLRPDFSTLIDLEIPEHGIDESFVIGDVFTLDEQPWACCLRGQLKAAIDTLRERHGISLTVAFEHEFHFSGARAQDGLGYSLRALRRMGAFPARLMETVEKAGLSPDTFSPEYGPGQCEVTVKPQAPLRAADEAVILREMTRAVARGLDARASFAPIIDPSGVGNGVHVHFSLQDASGNQVGYDRNGPNGLSEVAGRFVAGMLKYLPEYLCMTAPSVASYMRLTPHRWSAAFNNLGVQDREAAIRICPVFRESGREDISDRFHLEFRAADAAASPYLFLAALLRAGISGLDEQLQTPAATRTDLAELDEQSLADLGIERLPQSLSDALERLSQSDWAQQAFGPTLVDAYLRHKRSEVDQLKDLSDDEICAKYAEAY
ncbi:MAG: glutamine synthetase family protein [Pseudomonadota bacterium]